MWEMDGWMHQPVCGWLAVNLESGEGPLWKLGSYPFYLGNPKGLALRGALVLGPVGGPRPPARAHVKMRAVLCRRSCSCLVLLVRMLRRMMFSSGSSSSRTRGFSGCLVTSTSIRSRTCGGTGGLSAVWEATGLDSAGGAQAGSRLTLIWKSRRSAFSFWSLFFSSLRAWMRSFCSAKRLARFSSSAIMASSPSSSSSSSTPP